MRIRGGKHWTVLGFVAAILMLGAAFLTGSQAENVTAQTDTATCTDVIRGALREVGANCDGLSRNSVCYGFNQVNSTFSQVVPANFFSRPADRGELTVFERIQTASLRLQENIWGIAVLSIQANMPQTLPGQNVLFMLVGDTQLENAVPPGRAFMGGMTSPVVTRLPAALYVEPSTSEPLVANVPAGVNLEADAVTQSGDWVRVVYDGQPGWLMVNVIDAPNGLNLPVYTPQTRTSMQAFYFRTGIGSLDCFEAPSVLVVQGPQNLRVNINANGADMRLGSTVVMATLPIDPASLRLLFPNYTGQERIGALMQVTTLDGVAIIYPGTDREVVIPAGRTAVTCLTENRNLGIDGVANDRRVIPGCGWVTRDLAPGDLDSLTELEGFELLYPITLPQLVPLAPPIDPPTETPSGPPTATFTPSMTFTPSITPSITPTFTPSLTPTFTSTPPEGCPPVNFNIPDGDVAALIAAINAAQDEACFPGVTTINLASGGNYTFTAVHNNTDGANALPSITTPIVINGNGSFLGRDSGGLLVAPRFAPDMRIFHIAPGGSLELRQTDIAYGQLPSEVPGFNSSGGAILNRGSLTLIDSTVSQSYADLGGGIYNTGSLTMRNSTVGMNAAGVGGGIYNTGTAFVNFVTFSENLGETIYNSGTITLKNSALSAGSSSPNCFGSPPIIQGAVIVDDESCSGATFTDDIRLTGLAYNGGLTQTFVPEAGSPLREAAVDCTTIGGATVSFDQRGGARPQGPFCDAGSVEAAFVAPSLSDLNLIKTVNNPNPPVGALVEFTVTLNSNGPESATNVVVNDALPPGLVYASHVVSAGSYNAATGVWTVGNVSVEINYTLTLRATVASNPVGTILTNTASVESLSELDPNSGNDQASASVTVSAADLAITKIVDEPMPFEGDTIVYTITVENLGPHSASGITVNESLASGLNYLSHVETQGEYIPDSSTWTVGALGVGESATLTITVEVLFDTGGTMITNTASITGSSLPDPNVGNNSASATIEPIYTPQAYLGINKIVSDDTPLSGDVIEYTISVSNAGPDPATSVTVSDLLEPGQSFISATPSQGSYDPDTGIWNVGGLAVDVTATLNIFAQITAPTGSMITNTASITASTPVDPDPEDNASAVSLTVVAPTADLGVSKQVDDDTPVEAQLVVYTVTLTHNSGDSVSGVQVQDNLPLGLSYADHTVSQGSYNPGTGIWDIGALDSGDSATLMLGASVNGGTVGQTITNTATIINNGWTDPISTNNQSSIDLVVQPSCPMFPPSVGTTAELIDAINFANNEACFPGQNVINLATTTFIVTDPHNAVEGPTAFPVITSDIVINGNGAVFSKSGPNNQRYFHVAPGGTLSINNVANINDGSTGGAANGGAFLNRGTLTLSSVSIQGGLAVGQSGSGIANYGTLTLNTVSIYNGNAANGGGLYNEGGTVSVNETQIFNNTGTVSGGGILSVSGTVTIRRSTISGSSGDAVVTAGNMTIENSTISSNGSSGLVSSGITNVSFSTIAANVGAGYNNIAGTLRFKNSIIANNGDDCTGSVPSTFGVNLVSNDGCPSPEFTYSVGISLGGLASNGGVTQTHAIDYTSSAADAAPDCTDLAGNSIAVDQRGIGRPQSSACDLGSFEVQP